MRKQHIITLGVVFGWSLIALILLQIGYFNQAFEVKRQQFVFTVYKSMDEVLDYIRDKEKQYRDAESRKFLVEENGDINFAASRAMDRSPYPLNDPAYSWESEVSRFIGNKKKADNLKLSITKLQQAIWEELGKGYNLVFEKQENSTGRLEDIFTVEELQKVIKDRLGNNRILDNVEFGIKEESGDFVLESSNFNRYVEEYAFNKKIFPMEESSALFYLKFPNQTQGNEDFLWMVLPGIVVIVVLVVCAVLCIVIIVRQKRLSVMKNDFINNMTHEFKTPLATISLAAQMLKDGAVGNTPEKTDQIATIIRDESKRLTYQVERVLQTALFTDNRIKLKLKRVKIHDIITDFLPKLSLRVEDRGGVLSACLGAIQDEVMADEVHVTNVLSNLVDNAIKYSVRIPEIKISTLNKDGNILIAVNDNGIGIASKDQKLIFERFYRVSTGNLHDVKGFGLGLSYVKKIIEAHGGEIEVESVLGEGSRFNIILPLTGDR